MTTLDLTNTPERQILNLRVMGLPGARVLGRYRYSSPHPPLPPHRHRGMIEICYLHRGCQSYTVSGERHVLRGGEFFVTFPGEWHSTGPDPEDRGILYWLILDIAPRTGPFLGQDGRAGGELLRHLVGLKRRQFPAPSVCKRLLEDLLRLGNQKQNWVAKLAARAALIEFLLAVVQASDRHMERENPTWLPLVMRHIQSSLSDNPQVPDLAAVAGLSVSRFKVRFRELVGIAPAEYVLRQRIAVAEQLLRSGRKSVTQIAMDLGFSSSQAFATAFRRLTNRQPRELMPRVGK